MLLSKQETDFFDQGLNAVRGRIELFTDTPSEEFEIVTPKQIYDHLDKFVVGQERAKKIMSVVAHNHYKRLLIYKDSGFTKKLEKTNCLLLGPTGSGKTFMVKQLAEYLNVPVHIADANSLTAAGYVGKDAESIVEGLVNASDGNYDAAATGIIFIDEFDKIAKKKGGGGSKSKDVGGEAVQQALLKIIEGTVMDFEKSNGISKVKFQIDTSNILVIVGGAFVGLEDIIEKRMKINRETPIGFTGVRDPNKAETPSRGDILQYAINEDLENYGFIPEILGRLPLIAPLKELTVQDLINILTKVENNLVSQYVDLFKFSDAELVFEDDAIIAMAEIAKTFGTGARSLKTIMEHVLLESMFEVEHAHITAEYVTDVHSSMGKNTQAKTAESA